MRALFVALILGVAGAALMPSHEAKAWWDAWGRWHPDYRRPVVIVPAPVYAPRVYAPPPVVYARPYARWIPPHWDRWGRYVPGHWA